MTRDRRHRLTGSPHAIGVVVVSGEHTPVLLTRAQAAQLAQVSVSKLDQWSRQPGLNCPVIRQGQHFVRFPREKFIAWLAELDTQG